MWIVLELFVVSALMWFIVDYLTVMGITASTPTGFDIDHTYKVTLAVTQEWENNHVAYPEDSPEPWLNMQRIVARLREHPQVENVSVGSWHFPYCRSNMNNRFAHDSLHTSIDVLKVTPDYFRVFRVSGSDGNPEMLAAAISCGYVVSEEVEKRLFPGSSAVGQRITANGDEDEDGEAVTETFPIAGVTSLMKRTEFSRPARFIFYPLEERELAGQSETMLWRMVEICFRARAGVGADFAERFAKEMRAQLSVGNYYLSEITPISDFRDEQLQWVYDPMRYRIGFSIFFLINIFLGVIGTFWLRIEKRRSEIGLRMAVGSSRRQVLRQMMGEGIVLLLAAYVPAMLLCLNLSKMDLLSADYMDATPLRLLLNTVVTFMLLVVVVCLGTWYPARRSSKIEPAEALHYE